jgi:hypothetical protein
MAETSTDQPWTLTRMGPTSNTNANDPDQPDFETEECYRMRIRSKTCRDLRQGTAYMKTNAENYLPQYENEDNEDYKNRLTFSSFRNFYSKAVTSILGKVFSKPPAFNDDVPSAIQNHCKDADLNGNDWTIVAEKLFEHATDDGIAWVMVDYHGADSNEELTIEQERELGLRPYWVVIPQNQVLGVNYTKTGETYSISMFRYWTWVKVSNGEFGDSFVFEIHVYEPHRVRTYRKAVNDAGSSTKYELSKDKPITLGVVPVVPLNLNPVGPFEANPPMEDLAEMNIEHYQIRSDQRRSLSVASYPLLATFGAKLDVAARIGPMQSYNFEDPKADMKWVESQGVHLAAARNELKDLKEEIRNFALSFETPGMYATATAVNVDATDSVAPIIRWAFRMRDALSSVLYYHALWLKMGSGGTVDVDTSFIKSMLTVESLKILVQAFENGAITKETFLRRMKEYGIFGDKFDPAAEVERIDKEIADKAAAAPPPVPPIDGPPVDPTPPVVV